MKYSKTIYSIDSKILPHVTSSSTLFFFSLLCLNNKGDGKICISLQILANPCKSLQIQVTST